MPEVIYCPVCTTNDESDATASHYECNNCETVYAFAPAKLAMTMQARDWPEFSGAIVFCPTCCSHIDASGWGAREYACPDCSTAFTVILDPETVATHSRYG